MNKIEIGDYKVIKGQVNLRDAVNGTISFHDQVRNRVYRLNDNTAKLFVRPRGWHLPEAHVLIDGEPASGCLVNFGLYFFHNHARFRATQGAGYGCWNLGRTNSLTSARRGDGLRYIRIWTTLLKRLVF